jgi:D-lactate dehydrogenase
MPVSPIVDACIECGFCEPKCPSRRLTLTPRQRIVVQREISRLKSLPKSDSTELASNHFARGGVLAAGDGDLRIRMAIASLQADYAYDGLETCAVDGLCATACPVSINTGELTKHLRAEQVRAEKVAGWVASHFALVENSMSWGVKTGHFFDRISGTKWHFVLPLTEKITGVTLPKWNNSVPNSTKNLRALSGLRGKKDFLYFPSCISRQLGTPAGDSHLSLADTLTIVANRAGIALEIPADVTGSCCGMPFSSKGYTGAYKSTLHKTITKFWEWSEHGRYPILIDTTSCAHTLLTCQEALSSDDLALYQQMTILDSIEFIHDTLLPRMELHPVEEDVVLHPNCSARKLGLDGKLLSIARKCARSATVPLNLGCCAFAGDRGLLYPELTASATEKETAEVLSRNYGGYYSSNITCEMGMSEATGKDYVGIVYLVEKASR